MRFLIDANLPKALGAWINAKGHSSEHVLDLNLAQAMDTVLRLRAEATNTHPYAVSLPFLRPDEVSGRDNPRVSLCNRETIFVRSK